MSVENQYQCESPRSYVLMPVEWKEFRRWRGRCCVLLVMWSEGRVGSWVTTADAAGSSCYIRGFYSLAGVYTQNTYIARDTPSEMRTQKHWGRHIGIGTEAHTHTNFIFRASILEALLKTQALIKQALSQKNIQQSDLWKGLLEGIQRKGIDLAFTAFRPR